MYGNCGSCTSKNACDMKQISHKGLLLYSSVGNVAPTRAWKKRGSARIAQELIDTASPSKQSAHLTSLKRYEPCKKGSARETAPQAGNQSTYPACACIQDMFVFVQ